MIIAQNWHWQDFAELGSTNDKVKELTAHPPAEHFVVTAQTQTNGRGRRGRRWVGLDGNLFMTMGLPCELNQIGQLTFVVSYSLLQTILSFAPELNVKLKWPNDVLVNDKKISGILLEKGEGMYIIVGIGVNICFAPESFHGLTYSTTSLKEAGIETNRTDFLQAYLRHFNQTLALWREQGFEVIKNMWLQNAKGLNEEIVINMEKETKNGIFRGVDNNCMLLLEQAGQIQKIYAGDVFYKEEKK